MTLQQKQRALRTAVTSFFWHSSSRYDEEVLDNVRNSIMLNQVNFDDERFSDYDELAYHLMHQEMIKLGHL